MLQAEFATGAARHTCSPASTISAGAPWSTGVPARPRRWTRSTRSTATTPSAISRTTTTRRLEQTGVYLQDLIDIDQWRFSLGLRQDWVSVTDKNRSTGSKADDDWGIHRADRRAVPVRQRLAPYVATPSRSARTPIPTPPARPRPPRASSGTRPEVPGAGQQQLHRRLAVPYHPGNVASGAPGQLLHLGRRSALPRGSGRPIPSSATT